MIRRLAIFGIMCFAILMFVSCGVSDKFSEKYDSQKKDIIKEKIKEVDGVPYISKLFYDDVEYILEDKEIFFVTTPDLSGVPDEDDTVISWSGLRFGYSTVYYSETSTNPLFIYTPASFHDLYLRSDYDYMTDTFNVSGTDMEITLSSIISLNNRIDSIPVAYESVTKVRLISNTNSRIKCDLEIYKYNDSWYSVIGKSYMCELSSQMVQELKDNNVI